MQRAASRKPPATPFSYQPVAEGFLTRKKMKREWSSSKYRKSCAE
jgi:hypothetical protein